MTLTLQTFIWLNRVVCRCGDVIVSVNEHGLEKVTHTVAVEILKQVDGAVMLTVTSWPGTVV